MSPLPRSSKRSRASVRFAGDDGGGGVGGNGQAADLCPSPGRGGLAGEVSLYAARDEGERRAILDDLEYAMDGCGLDQCRLAGLMLQPKVRAVARAEPELLADVAEAACGWVNAPTPPPLTARFAAAAVLASMCVNDGDAAAFHEPRHAGAARAFAAILHAGPVGRGGAGDAEAENAEPLAGVLKRARKDRLAAAVGGHEWRRPPPSGRAVAAARLDADPRAYALACLERLLAPTSQSAARQAAADAIKSAVREDGDCRLIRALLSVVAASRDNLEPRSDAWTTTMLLRGALRALVELTFVDHGIVDRLWGAENARGLVWSVLSGAHAFAKPRVHRPSADAFAHVEASLLRDGSLAGETYQEATKLLINVTQASPAACEASVSEHRAIGHVLEVVAACCACPEADRVVPRADCMEVLKMALCLVVNLLESSGRARVAFACDERIKVIRGPASGSASSSSTPSSSQAFLECSALDFLCALVWNDAASPEPAGASAAAEVTAADLERTERVSQECIVQMYAALALGVLVVGGDERPQAHGARASQGSSPGEADGARAHAAALSSVSRAAGGSGVGGAAHLAGVLGSLRDFHRHTGTLTSSQMGALTHVVLTLRRRSEASP